MGTTRWLASPASIHLPTVGVNRNSVEYAGSTALTAVDVSIIVRSCVVGTPRYEPVFEICSISVKVTFPVSSLDQ